MNAKIKTTSEILQAIDRIGMAQTVAYNALEGNNLMRAMIYSSELFITPALSQVAQENIQQITGAFESWAKSLDALVQLRHAILATTPELTSPAAVAEQIIAALAQDTEFDTL
jgi:hypothetical protein